MRFVWVVAIVAACKMGPAPAAKGSGAGSGSAVGSGSGSGSGSAAPADAMVELLHSVPATIRLSSRVANKAILPMQIADRDLNTAWNSSTGELEGAWIDLDVPSVPIDEVRLTVGHTGKGPKGEDYFTMNPRIKKLAVFDDAGQSLENVELDVTRRDLQVIKLLEPRHHVRLVVTGVVVGNKRAWRETCVSEIEAWGKLPAGVTAHAMQPTIEVAEPNADWETPPLDPSTYCTHYLDEPSRKYKAEMAAEEASCDACMKHIRGNDDFPCLQNGSCNPDPPGPPSCALEITARVSSHDWRGAGTVETSTDSVYTAITKQLVVTTREGAWPFGDTYDCGHFSDTPSCDLAVVGAKVVGDKLEVTATYTAGDKTTDLAYVCTAPAAAPVSCESK